MTASKGARRVLLGAEVALAFGVGAASFALVAVTVAAIDSDVLAVVVGVACLAAVLGIARVWGVAYAAPAAVGSLLAFDWFRFPPTHAHEFPSAADLANLFAYIAVAVLIGELAAHAGRRADVTEVARSELADEQAALRRVATLVAHGVAPEQIFTAVAAEAGELLGVDGARVVRYAGDDEIVQLAGWNAPGYDPPSLGRAALEPTSLVGMVFHTRRAARIDDYEALNRSLPEPVERAGARAGVGAPIVVDGELWGAMAAWLMHPEPLAPSAEARLVAFTELVATAISNTESRGELARLAEEQAALRRVATLVAHGVAPPEVFAAVAREVGLLLGVDATHMARYELDGAATGVAAWSPDQTHVAVGMRVEPSGESVVGRVLKTGRPARMSDYEHAAGPGAALGRQLGVRASVGAPIVVDLRLWGVMIASSKGDRDLPADTESRIAAFTELVATAISNTEARAQVQRLADEHAALRRVATLVARASPAAEVFAKVAEEVGLLLGADSAWMYAYEPDGTARVVASWGELDAFLPVAASPLNLEGIGSPIVVDGRPWGAIVVGTGRPVAADTEARIAEFTELVATAISNTQARSDLAASRARVVAAADDERRRVVRDLHDGAQQRLVHTIITLKLARTAIEDGRDAAPRLVTEALDQAELANAELRELAHGILPAVLTRGGLRAGVDALASRMPVPVENEVSVGRLPAPVEATAYFVVAEALTNVAKHACARRAAVTARVEGGTLSVLVRDDGIGGAQVDGSGLLGLGDRLAVLDGRLRIESPADGGTLVAAAIPLGGR